MNNTSIKGRLTLCGGMAYMFRIAPDWEMPEIYIPKPDSWEALNRGKRSKRDRRK